MENEDKPNLKESVEGLKKALDANEYAQGPALQVTNREEMAKKYLKMVRRR